MADTWTPIDDTTAFQDDAVFEIDKTTKTIQVLVEQPIVAGENKSQFVKFQMGRYYDAIDLTQMEVNILYESPAGNGGISSAVNREYSDEYIRFGWLVPYAACPVKGTLSFAVEFAGEDYVLKTTRGSTPVLDSIDSSSAVPEPVEQTWYIELQSQVAAAINNANSTLETVTELVETFQGGIDGAISDWLDAHPEATTTVQDGTITEAKLASDSVSSDKVQDGAITEAKLGKDIYIDKYRNVCAVPDTNVLLADIGIDYTQLYTLQGGCYNSNNNHIILAFHKADNPDCIVKELDKDWNLLKTVTLTLYHANDITYNSKADKYYVADGENTNTIYEIDSELSSVKTIAVYVNDVVAQISYDAINDRYYLLVNRKIYTCDSVFDNIVYHATLDTSNDYSGVQSIYTGGSCMLGDSFVSMLWFYRDSAQPESNTRLYFANADKDYTGYYFDFRSHTTPDEAEVLLEFPDKIVCVGYYADNLTRSNIYTKGMHQEGLVRIIGAVFSNVNRVPVNSYGVCTIKASSSPTGEDITGAYICYGKYDMRMLKLTTASNTYYRYCYANNTWTNWHSNKDVLQSLIVSESLTIATGETIAAGSSSPEYMVEIPAKAGYTPFLAVHRSVSAPVIFEWYMYLVADSSKASGYVVKCRYRNTGTQQTNQNINATIFYVRTT